MLWLGGQRYHVAHTVLLLLRMLQAYMTFQEAVPLLAAETARRAVDLLKVTSLLETIKLAANLPPVDRHFCSRSKRSVDIYIHILSHLCSYTLSHVY